MSILKSTNSGARYIQFQERLDKFTKFALYSNKHYYKASFYVTTISFYLPLRRLTNEELDYRSCDLNTLHVEDDSFLVVSEEIWTYDYNWTEEQFKNNFIEYAKICLRPQFEIYDIYFPLRYLNLNDIYRILKSREHRLNYIKNYVS